MALSLQLLVLLVSAGICLLNCTTLPSPPLLISEVRFALRFRRVPVCFHFNSLALFAALPYMTSQKSFTWVGLHDLMSFGESDMLLGLRSGFRSCSVQKAL